MNPSKKKHLNHLTKLQNAKIKKKWLSNQLKIKKDRKL